MKRIVKFKNTYVLDTNIILNDVENIFKLSNNGETLIVLPETVLDELDSKKSGFDEINYQAREFGRLYDDSEVLQIDRASNKKLITISSRVFRNGNVAYLNVISKKKYDSDNDNSIAPNIKNDRKIIEIARDLQTESSVKNVFFVSLDIMAKHRALSIGLEVINMKVQDDKLIQLSAELNLEEPETEYSVFDIFSMDVPDTVQHVKITSKDGKPYFYYRTGNIFTLIDEKSFGRHEVKPNNLGQKVLLSQMMDEYYDIIVSDSPAGCTLAGTKVDVKFRKKYITKEQVKDFFNIDSNILAVLRNKKLVNYKKVTNKTLIYELSSFTSVVLKYSKLTPSQKTIFENDKKYTSKYLKLRYWLSTDKSLEWSLNFLKKARFRYLKYFEPCIDELVSQNFNPENIHETIIKIQQYIITGNDLPFSNMTKDFWKIRGYNNPEEIISALQKKNSNKKSEKYTLDDFRRSSIRCKEYWIDKGYSKEQAIQEVSKIQNTFSLEKCIEKHGKVVGKEIFEKRQEKWQNTLKSKSKEEIDAINRKKGTKAGSDEPNFGSYSFERFQKNPELALKEGYLYYIKFINDKKEIYKIGITTNLYSRVRRFHGDIIWAQKSNLLDCFSKEQFLLEKYKKYRISIPGVSTELFNTNILELENK